MCLENVKWSVGGRYGEEGIPHLSPMLFTQEKYSNVLLLLDTLVLQMYELYIQSNPWTPASRASFTLLTIQSKDLSHLCHGSSQEKSTSSAANIRGFWLRETVSLTDGQQCKKFGSLPAVQNESYRATDIITREMQTPEEGCKAEGNRKVSIRFASFAGTRSTILRRSHCLGAKQDLMWMLTLSQLAPEDWELINLYSTYSTGSSFFLL